MPRTSLRPEEEFARHAFLRHLHQQGISEVNSDRGDDPPDYTFDVGGKIYNVEVTTIVSSRVIGNRQHTELELQHVLEGAAARIEAEMKRRGVLRGTFALDIQPVVGLNAVITEVLPLVESYLEETSEQEIAPAALIYRTHCGVAWRIRKIGSRSNLLRAELNGAGKGVPQIRSELQCLLRSAAENKTNKTRRLSNVILLLLDSYGYADPEDWEAVAAEIDFSAFSGVLRVYQSAGHCQILYGDVPSGNRSPAVS